MRRNQNFTYLGKKYIPVCEKSYRKCHTIHLDTEWQQCLQDGEMFKDSDTKKTELKMIRNIVKTNNYNMNIVD